MRTIVINIFIKSLFITAVHAQAPYDRALGIKFPGGLSLTYKKFIADTRNIEAQLTAWHQGLRVSGLYEFNFYSFKGIPALSWFVGPGVHVGFWKSSGEKNYDSKADIGIDGVIGFDYKFKSVPVNISVDWEPAVTLIGSAGFTPVFGGIAVRYTF
jgi:hypothetical protein